MAYVGYTGVANQANTSPGFAVNTVADAALGYGDDVGGGGVVDLYGETPIAVGYILFETKGYVLKEDSSKIQMEAG